MYQSIETLFINDKCDIESPPLNGVGVVIGMSFLFLLIQSGQLAKRGQKKTTTSTISTWSLKYKKYRK